MNLIGQPESYSDILRRVFVATLTTGVLCTFALASTSESVRVFLESWSAEASIGILESVKALYVIIPLAVAIVSRAFRLHDKISDLFGIRERFDLDDILHPLAVGVGFPTTGEEWESIKNNRKLAMTRSFYRYASFESPKIDVQLVRAAADRWAWFWCAIEPQVILLITAFGYVILAAWPQACYIIAVMAFLTTMALLLWREMRAGARNQVDEILAIDQWKSEVRAALEFLCVGTIKRPADDSTTVAEPT